MTQQRRFTKDFAEEAVRLVQTSGRTQREMAGDLGIGLRRWFAGSAGAGIGALGPLCHWGRRTTDGVAPPWQAHAIQFQTASQKIACGSGSGDRLNFFCTPPLQDGIPSEETKNAIRICARLGGMITDPVYEGKSMQGMIDLVKRGYFEKGARVLYAHLGGAPALNGYGYAFRNG